MSKNPKLTPWFSASVNPSRPGEYEVVRTHVGAGYPKRTRLIWTGRRWAHTDHSSNNSFAGSFAAMSGREGDKWRGLAANPILTRERGMSMHKQPLTALEREGLEKHGLPIGTASQLSDSFRLGVRWALQSGYADHSHQCRACGLAYTPPEGAPSEDCPACGSDGILPTPSEHTKD